MHVGTQRPFLSITAIIRFDINNVWWRRSLDRETRQENGGREFAYRYITSIYTYCEVRIQADV